MKSVNIIGIFLSLFFSVLFADDIDENQTYDYNQTSVIVSENENQTDSTKAIYLYYKELPKRVVKGEVFFVTLKNVTVVDNITDILYNFTSSQGVEVLNDSVPIKRIISGHYYYDTLAFFATSSNVKLPDIEAIAVDADDNLYKPVKLKGKKIDSFGLNPPKNYSNIVAKDLKLTKYKTTTYDNKSNIVVLSIEAKQTLLKNFSLNGVIKQGIDSVNKDILNQKMIYYAIIDNSLEKLSFSYFDIDKNGFVNITVPIIVDDDRVTTQTDLNPHSNTLNKFEILVSVSVMILGIVLLLVRKKLIYSLLIFIPAFYVIYIILLPKEKVCVKQGSFITILPLYNSTVFEKTKHVLYLEKIGKTKGWTKVKLSEEKIGWVRDDDICKN